MLRFDIALVLILTVAVLAFAVVANVVFQRSWAEKKGKRNPRWHYLEWEKDELPSWWFRGAASIIGGLFALGLVASLFPFAPQYWFLTSHTGTVATSSNRFVDGTGDLSGGTYTITLAGDPTPLVVTDSRILALQVGDEVSVTCSLQWVYGGADQNNCYMASFSR